LLRNNKDWKIRANDILISVERIFAYTKNQSYKDFEEDQKTIDAVLRDFEIIGEAAKHIPIEISKKIH
jgi:uncharacterized protein with HEPN domain